MKTILVAEEKWDIALLGAQFFKYVKRALTKRVLAYLLHWTDRFRVRNLVGASAGTFVVNHIETIKTITDRQIWRFAPGRINSSDQATHTH